jgi:alkylation response protein AidB-like acyl-CoA dehydrogenase
MDLAMSADQRALRAGLRDYLEDAWTPDRLRSAADAPGIDRKDWSALAELGVFSLNLPESREGMGLGLVDAAIVFEELGRALVPGPLVATFLAAGLVPGAADGDAVVTALDVDDPVQLIEHPGSATHVMVVSEHSLRLVTTDMPARPPQAVPLDPLTPVSRLTVPPEAGEQVGNAADAGFWRLQGTVLTSALQVGVAQGALDLAVRYAGERSQFGRLIGSFQAVKHLLAEALVRVDLARAAVWEAALTIDDPGAGDVVSAVPTAKILADDAATANGRVCVQVHGGMGFTWEVLAHLYLKRAWLLEACFGSPDEHAQRLADTL